MIDDIVKNKAFGKVTSYFVVVEFQKRGLPNTHQSYTLAEEDKPRSPEDIDKIVCAEIPEKPETSEGEKGNFFPVKTILKSVLYNII